MGYSLCHRRRYHYYSRNTTNHTTHNISRGGDYNTMIWDDNGHEWPVVPCCGESVNMIIIYPLAKIVEWWKGKKW